MVDAGVKSDGCCYELKTVGVRIIRSYNCYHLVGFASALVVFAVRNALQYLRMKASNNLIGILLPICALIFSATS